MANSGVAPVNLTTDVGRVRVLLGDTDPTNVSAGYGTYLYFSDNELTALLGMYNNDPRLTAARCLETIAGSQALLLKSWSSDDLAVRGDAIAESLRKIAKQLRDEATADASSESFEIIPLPLRNDYLNDFEDIAYYERDYHWWN
jgi:hypothetical protein